MGIGQIKERMIEINQELKRKINSDCDLIRSLITQISEDAINIKSGQGLSSFLNTRDTFHQEIERLRSEYQYLLCKNADDPK